MSTAQVSVEGELDFASVPRWLRQADALAAGGVLDLSRVSRADSAGLAFLLELSRRSQGLGRPLAIRNAAPQVRNLAHFFGLDQALRFE